MKADSRTRPLRFAITAFQAGSWVSLCLFLLLVTSSGLHWWQPPRNRDTSRVLLILLVVLCATYSVFYGLLVLVRVRGIVLNGYHRLAVQRVLVSTEVSVLYALLAFWGRLVWAGQPASLPAKLAIVVWILWSMGIAVLHVSVPRQSSGKGASAP